MSRSTHVWFKESNALPECKEIIKILHVSLEREVTLPNASLYEYWSLSDSGNLSED